MVIKRNQASEKLQLCPQKCSATMFQKFSACSIQVLETFTCLSGPWSLAQGGRADEQLQLYSQQSIFWVNTGRQSKYTGIPHVKYLPVVLEMLENVLQVSLSVVTVRTELGHVGPFDCICSMVSNSWAWGGFTSLGTAPARRLLRE